MHQLQPSAVPQAASPERTLRLAWLTLLFFVLLFAVLLGWAGLTLRGVYLGATLGHGATLFLRGPAETIAWRPADRTLFQGAADQQPLAQGDSVRIAAAAGYGQVASIRLFEQSQLDLWAGTEVTLETLRTSRWHSGTLEVALRQHSGYVRYDLKPALPFESVVYTLHIGDASVALEPGGSYSVEMRAPERPVERADGGNRLVADVAVRSGQAVVYGANGAAVELRTRERVLVDAAGVPGLAVPARWELVRDGGFSQFSELEYNNTTSPDPTVPRADTWQVYGIPDRPPENRGYFRLSQICRPPAVDNTCGSADRRTAAWFYRTGGQTTSFTTGIKQDLGPNGQGVDISEYRSLSFSLWARILYQSLNDVGDRGSECPVMIRLVAKRSSPADPEEERVICVYTDADGQPPAVREPGVQYLLVERAAWSQVILDLRDPVWLPDYRYLRSIQIYANGHDYDSRVAEVSLVGEQ
ncbi:MAG: hypothetical protein OHK0015_33160 [Chloroflexi bacterium OHK40]